MSGISFLNGIVRVANQVYCVTDVSITRGNDLIETTSTCDDGNATYIPGITRVTGSLSSNQYIPVSPSQLVAFEATNDDVGVTGSAYLQLTIDATIADKVTYSYDITFSGVVLFNEQET